MSKFVQSMSVAWSVCPFLQKPRNSIYNTVVISSNFQFIQVISLVSGMLLDRKRNNYKSTKITETIYTSFQNLIFYIFRLCPVTLKKKKKIPEENSWKQLNNWRKTNHPCGINDECISWSAQKYQYFFNRVDTSAGTRPMNLWSGQLKFISYIHRIGKISQSSLLNVCSYISSNVIGCYFRI